MSTLIPRELNSGLIIVGAYAAKIRRTLFAQLSDLVKQSKEFSKEIARASGELNTVIYNILVNELKLDKGDVVRIRIKYTADPDNKKISWHYDTLRIEAFKKMPSKDIDNVVDSFIRKRLDQVVSQFRAGLGVVEEKVEAYEVEERPPTPPPVPTHVPPGSLTPRDIVNIIGSIDMLGEIAEGGYLFKIVEKRGKSLGLISLSQIMDEIVIDGIVIHEETPYKIIIRSKGRIEMYLEDPSRIISELEKASLTIISKDDAEKIIREKMQSLL